LAISLDLEDEEKELINDLFLLSNKPFIYAINIDETRINL
jgi:ribosome-binding ATPase YchF (GTP1/OBG family)